jgi:CBS domain-containing protein
VDCSVPQECLDAEADPTGEHTEIGALLRAGTMVIAQSATVGAAVRLMNSKDLRSVAIVDEHDVLVGVVRESGFLGRSRASESALQLAMSTPLAVHEQTPVRLALRMLAANHLREITVVAEDGTPIGVFRDVDGLHWIAVARGAIPEDGEEG